MIVVSHRMSHNGIYDAWKTNSGDSRSGCAKPHTEREIRKRPQQRPSATILPPGRRSAIISGHERMPAQRNSAFRSRSVRVILLCLMFARFWDVRCNLVGCAILARLSIGSGRPSDTFRGMFASSPIAPIASKRMRLWMNSRRLSGISNPSLVRDKTGQNNRDKRDRTGQGDIRQTGQNGTRIYNIRPVLSRVSGVSRLSLGGCSYPAEENEHADR